MLAPLDCPATECWPKLDRVSPEERERHERHLESCVLCQDRLDRLRADEDAFLILARKVGDPTAAPADPTLIQVLQRLREVKSLKTKAEPASKKAKCPKCGEMMPIPDVDITRQ